MTTPPSRRGFVSTAAAAALAGGPSTDIVDTRTFRDRLRACLGGPWPEPCPLEARSRDPVAVDGWRIESGPRDGYHIESIDYLVEPGERVPALVLVPDGVDAAHPAPAVAVWHQHNREWHLGESEPDGTRRRPDAPHRRGPGPRGLERF